VELAINIVVGVLSGLLSSALFFFLLRGLRPEIEISPAIARSTQGGYTYYDFKIVNRSSRSAINVQAHLVLATQTNVQGGPIYKTLGIELTRNTFFELGAFSEEDKDAAYALRFTTVEDIEGMWANESIHLRMRVMATDSESGFSKSFMHDFRVKRNAIQDGQHEFGRSLAVA
jgi:hypothetical protein